MFDACNVLKAKKVVRNKIFLKLWEPQRKHQSGLQHQVLKFTKGF